MYEYLPLYLKILTGIAVFGFGLIMGSFLYCLSLRLVTDRSVLRGRSCCDFCGHVLGAADLIPVISWLFLKGRCRYCGKALSVRYPVTELLCASGYLGLYLRYGVGAGFWRYSVLFSLLFAAALADFEAGWIPDRFIIAGLAGGVLTAFFIPGQTLRLLKNGVIGSLVLYVILFVLVMLFDRILGRESMGGGDLKLYALCGFWFGTMQGVLLIFLSCIIGLCTALAAGRLRSGAELRLAPSIALAAYAVMQAGVPILRLYLALYR